MLFQDIFLIQNSKFKSFFSKPNVTPVEVMSVYPDFVNWKYPCAQVIFDSDPAPNNSTKHVTAQLEEMSQAMIRFVFCLKLKLDLYLDHAHFSLIFQGCDGRTR